MVLDTGDGYHEDGQSRDPSRAFICLITSSTLVTSRTDVNLPNDPSQNDLGQDNQSSRDLEPTRDDLHSGGGDASRLDFLNADDGALPRRESTHGAPATDVGRTDNNASRGCHTSPKLQLS